MPWTLPTPENNSGTNDWSDVYANDKALKENGEELETKVNATAHPVTYYAPTVIPAEQSTSSTSFTTLSTADEITGVVVPTNALLVVTYLAAFKGSVAAAGKAAIFVGSEQLKVKGIVQEVSALGTATNQLSTSCTGLDQAESANISSAPEVIAVSASSGRGGSCVIRALAGTYTVSVKYRATSGSVTAQARSLWVEVHGT